MSETTETIEAPVLSRPELKRLAKRFVLGRELLAEIERLEAEGVVFHENPDAYEGPSPERVSVLLRGAEPHPEEESWAIASKREKALALARKDPDFLKVCLDDLHYWREREVRHGQVHEHVYVRYWEGDLLDVIAQALGYNDHLRGYYAGSHHHDGKHLLAYDFEERLKTQAPSWLDLLRSKKSETRATVRKRLGDPSQPEEVVLGLVERRLTHFERELNRTLIAERRLHLRKQEQKAEKDDDRKIGAAWEGFFNGDSSETPTLAPLPEPARERPVAPSLSEDGISGP